MSYQPSENRYPSAGQTAMPYRRIGRSGLRLPAVSLGLWHNFGDEKPFETQRAILRRAFDLGITHFDLANNYGTPDGSAETNFGRHVKEDFAPFRDELIISTKAGYRMWPGPYGDGGSRKYLLSSLDQSLKRMGLEYVDIFYSHRFDPDTPLEETMAALDTAVRSGRALYAGISSYSAEYTVKAARILRELGTPMVIHQPNYNIVDRWIEKGEPSLLDVLEDEGAGTIAFAPLAGGLLTERYTQGIPQDSRAATGFFSETSFTQQKKKLVHDLAGIAAGRGQTLAQMAIAWVLREQHKGATVASALVGASSVKQLEDNVGAVATLDFQAEELAAIDSLLTGDRVPAHS
ncbi:MULTISPECIES: L-glyceraldehyde 3-phosphate reductase [Arthrobacter]|uniref:L-glyceraldehyde 3-phosphate reductase n=1 Tax=Arthrobacter TaxID=1663 RepID=UPI00254F8862|nr:MULTISPECIES: L-glyceraldehyde 3-phosphate reductase [Arthrobacter]